jgi:DnaJ domain
MPLDDDWEKIFDETQKGGARTPEEEEALREKREKIKQEHTAQSKRIHALIAASKPNVPDYYDVLHIKRGDDLARIKKHFKSLSLLFHPDKGGDPEIFRLVNDAYVTLSDSASRAKYDAGHSNTNKSTDIVPSRSTPANSLDIIGDIANKSTDIVPSGSSLVKSLDITAGEENPGKPKAVSWAE